MALLFGDILEAVAVGVIVRLGQLPDVVALVAVLGEGHRVLAQEDLQVPGLQGGGEFLDLVAGVVDVELPPDLRSVGLQHSGQGIAQDAAPGVAHVHGAGGVGGDKLHHDLPARQGVGAAVGRALALHGVHDPGVPGGAEAEVEEARPGDLRGGEIAAGEVQVLQQNLGDVPGTHLHGLGGRQGEGGGIVAVGGVLGDLHPGPDGYVSGELPGGGGFLVGFPGQGKDLVLGVLNHVDHLRSPFSEKYSRIGKTVFIDSAGSLQCFSLLAGFHPIQAAGTVAGFATCHARTCFSYPIPHRHKKRPTP